MKSSKVLLGLFVALLFVVAAQTAMAQSTIFNIPSGDTVDKGKAYIEFDFLDQVPGVDATTTTPSYHTLLFNPRLVVGGPHDTEFGVNFPTYRTTNGAVNGACSAASPSTTCGYIEPNLKWKFYKNDDQGLSFVGGALLHTPLNGRYQNPTTGVQTNETWGLFYGNFTKKIKTGDYGPRFSAGPYVVADSGLNDFTSFGSHRAGVILGYEQPLSKKVNFVADWYSGKNYYGYFTPGISITLPGNGLFNAGYSIGNDSWANSDATKNRYVFLYYGITF
ncbi:MAG TPA: hypothetical protein VGK48_20690 [Terriglobia bacterium]